MRYCRTCIMPDTRPDQIFDTEGVCNACLSYQINKKIDWKKRKKKFEIIVNEAKSNKDKWNCIVPSSGGKDSTYQALRARELGLNPLLITASTCDLSIIGRKNIENLKKKGFDTIEISNSNLIRNKLNKISLETIGDISWPEHVSIFTTPIKFALYLKIPLILYGENPQIEYGGPKKSLNNSFLDRAWLEEFGGLIGLRVSDISENFGIKKKNLEIYKYPTKQELREFKIKSIFLGYYENWDSIRNFQVAKKNGFLPYSKDLEGCYFNFEKIDNYQHGIHDYFKFLKFGFGRATDQLSYSVRRGLIKRNKAIKIVKKIEGKYPITYMGKKLEDILKKINMTENEFVQICDRFTNKKIFKCDKNGKLIKNKNGDLKKNNYDNLYSN